MFDPLVIVSGAFVGFVVGLTGMGGGALMTPILVLLFKVQPLAAVSSDIVASMPVSPTTNPTNSPASATLGSIIITNVPKHNPTKRIGNM